MFEIIKGTNKSRPDGRLQWRYDSGGTVSIVDIHVDGECRRCGVGKSMVQDLQGMLKPGTMIWAITRAENIIAQEFWEGMRFRVIGVLRDFYATDPHSREGVDAIMYGRAVGAVS